jgi:hypothetical protein
MRTSPPFEQRTGLADGAAFARSLLETDSTIRQSRQLIEDSLELLRRANLLGDGWSRPLDPRITSGHLGSP